MNNSRENSPSPNTTEIDGTVSEENSNSYSKDLDGVLNNETKKILQDEDIIDDNQSAISDLHSINTKSTIKANSLKKLSIIVNKLRNENLLLKNGLEKVNSLDSITLSTKLRIANSDINKLKQHNTDLKDRVQVLEEKLFETLHANNIYLKLLNFHDISINEELLLNKSKIISKQNEIITPKPTGNETIIKRVVPTNTTIKSLESKCNHLSRLVSSYEKRILLMQVFTISITQLLPH